jgi:predicted transcriptional regulator
MPVLENSAVVMMSIHPEYVARLMDGTKRVEFRRSKPRRPLQRIVVYATAPVSQVVGHLTISRTVSSSPAELWHLHGHEGGISREAFDRYFEGVTTGYAFIVDSATRYTQPYALETTPPQSFRYLPEVQPALDY